jgi:hypothetical protein
VICGRGNGGTNLGPETVVWRFWYLAFLSWFGGGARLEQLGVWWFAGTGGGRCVPTGGRAGTGREREDWCGGGGFMEDVDLMFRLRDGKVGISGEER